MARIDEIFKNYTPYQRDALRKKYTDEEIQLLHDRWHKPLLKPGSFIRDEETGRITSKGDKPETIEVDGCKTFQELLTKRLDEIKTILEPEIEKIDVSLSFKENQDQFQMLWRKHSSELFEKTIKDLKIHGLELLLSKCIILSHIDLRFASLSNQNLSGGALFFGYFDGAECKKTSFYGTNFSKASFFGANCSKARFDWADLWYVHLDGVFCFDTYFYEAFCVNANFNGANCLNAHFDGARLYEATFEPVEAIQSGVITKDYCILSGATYEGASFIGVNTADVDWSKNPGMKRYIEQQQFIYSLKEKTHKILHPAIDLLDYLSSFTNWVGWAVIILLAFSAIYSFLGIESINFTNDVNWFTPIYFSIVTFTTLGFGDIQPVSALAQVVVSLEVFVGYIFLGGLVTFLANWLGRK